MSTRRELFLRAVLGPDGAAALEKASQTSPALAAVLAPRAALAWLAAQSHYEGAIPGVSDSHLRLQKAVAGLDGWVTVNGEAYEFQSAPVVRVAAAVVAALGEVAPLAKAARDVDLARLGRTIDRLVARRALHKGAPAGPQRGLPAAPIAPVKAEPKEDFVEEGASPPIRSKLPRPSKPKVTAAPLKLSEREAYRACPVCAAPQVRDARFTGCYCFRDLAKTVRTVRVEDGYELHLGTAWDGDAVLTLLEAVGRR